MKSTNGRISLKGRSQEMREEGDEWLERYAVQVKLSDPAPTSKWYLAMPRSILL